MRWKISPSSSRMGSSVGFTLRLIFPLVLVLATVKDRVTLRAPLPPAIVGRPTPNLYWVALALRGLRTGAETGGRTREGPARLLAGSDSWPPPFPSSSVS